MHQQNKNILVMAHRLHGSEAAKNAPGTSCPSGHSKAFCKAYNAAARTLSKNNNINSQHNGSSAVASNNVSLSSSQQAVGGNITCNSPIYNGTCPPASPTTDPDAYIKCVSAARAVNDLKGELKCTALLSDTPENAYTKCVSAAMVIDDLKGQLKCASLLPDTGPNEYTKCVSAAMVIDDLKGQLKCAALLPDTPENAYTKCVSAAMVKDDLTAELKCANFLRKDLPMNAEVATITPAIGTIIPGVGSTVTGSKTGVLQQIPSNVTDFPNNDPSVIQVHVTSSEKDITGAYHVTGEITDFGNESLSPVAVTAHLYDATGNLVADTLGYSTPTNINPGHTATFDSLVLPDQVNGKPVSFRLSFDWS